MRSGGGGESEDQFCTSCSVAAAAVADGRTLADVAAVVAAAVNAAALAVASCVYVPSISFLSQHRARAKDPSPNRDPPLKKKRRRKRPPIITDGFCQSRRGQALNEGCRKHEQEQQTRTAGEFRLRGQLQFLLGERGEKSQTNDDDRRNKGINKYAIMTAVTIKKKIAGLAWQKTFAPPLFSLSAEALSSTYNTWRILRKQM